MFKKILIANRGEIACRVIKSAKKMGIATVAVYSEADRDAVHVAMADEAVLIGPAASAESYLVIDKIVQAIKDTGADAVHPGYGFLSENSAFAQRLKDENVTFIGPEELAINAMGDKIESKKLAEEAKVNVIPGHTAALKDADEAVEVSESVGYPVMIKASAGGGGKGMRVAWNAEEAREGFRLATNEAVTSFGDDRIFIEKFIEEPRHIEIQILADGQGNTIYLAERECSIQRRHQKVIEEAPSPFIDEKTRKAMGEQAVKLSEAVNYKSAGTVEFIVDKNRNFYFLEMNTRLQVEHPITEFITGQDIVEWMIKIAAGEKLTLKQSEVKIKGWAIESRIYAEDPFRNFLPSTGRLIRYMPPEETDLVRVDTGVEEGGEISMFYDPMIAKLVTYGTTRDAAIRHMQQALDEFYIDGVSHNISFLAAVLAHPRFHEGRLTTNFIAEEYADGFHSADVPHDDPAVLAAVSAAIHSKHVMRNAHTSGRMTGASVNLPDEWVILINQEEKFSVEVNRVEGGYDVKVEGEPYEIRTDWAFGEPLYKADINNKHYCLQVSKKGVGYEIIHAGTSVNAMALSKRAAELNDHMLIKEAPDMSKFLLSPMPGVLVSISVEAGQNVKAGEELAVVEAMKMENVLKADVDGTVVKVAAAAGDSLAVDQIIVEFE
ncbi:MAG: acetyl/propionyl/methylcrotonyl-CoA carboxylase subunit alpha [Alphaproteobacteria bacterium]|nr:acetyl/propionyl/methylcrotonyl-CoA carboxylase subunit alpha [Rhodospirillales bacterium]MCW9045660.1 acetyl/propionyl/methylcrotonyl-CoA carboxylase subunit alpha [Alphaproteobacteria bacterium]